MWAPFIIPFYPKNSRLLEERAQLLDELKSNLVKARENGVFKVTHPYSCKSLARKKCMLVSTSGELIIVPVVSKEATAVSRDEVKEFSSKGFPFYNLSHWRKGGFCRGPLAPILTEEEIQAIRRMREHADKFIQLFVMTNNRELSDAEVKAYWDLQSMSDVVSWITLDDHFKVDHLARRGVTLVKSTDVVKYGWVNA
ncbi:hypothetical protein RYX36_014434 [Vicia faba]